MGESEAFSVVHAEVLDRIARRVSLSSGAGRYIGIGASAARRGMAIRELQGRLGEDRVRTIDVSTAEEDPWSAVLAHHRASGSPARGALYIACGLRAARASARARGAPDPYAQLNLARDAWGATGLHLLLWLDSPAELDAFLHEAPDLWRHRDAVGWFLSREDFVDPEEDTAAHDPYEARIAQARATLARGDATAVERVAAYVELAECLDERGEPWEAWQAVGQAGRLERSLRGNEAHVAALRWQLAIARARGLAGLGRHRDAEQELGRVLAQRARLANWARQVTQLNLLRVVPDDQDVEEARRLVQEDLGANQPTALDNLALTLGRLGRIAHATQTAGVSVEAGLDPSFRKRTEAILSSHQGDRGAVLRAGHAAVRGLTATGHTRVSGASARKLAESLDDLGFTAEAGAEVATLSSGDPLAALRASALLLRLRWRRGSTEAESSRADLEERARALLATWDGRAVAIGDLGSLVGTIEADATPDDPIIPWLEALVTEVRSAAHADTRHHRDPEVAGACTWALAALAKASGDHPRAWSLANGVIVPWARRWRGALDEVNAWRLLAEVAPTPVRASQFAARAVTLADATPSLFAQIHARETQAEVRAHQGDLPGAAAGYTEALALARSEGLRDDELRILHALAELPGHPGARAAASESLVLARSLMLPREEARALLNLALLDRRAASAAHRLDRAWALVHALGPPRLKARVAAARAASPP